MRERKVLVVDDNDPYRSEIATLLNSNGYTANAATGSKALVRFFETQPDIVVIEIVMAEQEGLDRILKLRQLRRDVTIIAITGGVRARSYLKTAQLLGADAALEKPFRADELLKVLVQWQVPR
jgi:two-component system, chemotaxis family, chemotaxis protein CheY